MTSDNPSTPKQRWGERIFAMVKRAVQPRPERGKERSLVLKMDNCWNNKVIVAQNYAADDGLVERVGEAGGTGGAGNQDAVAQQPQEGTE